MIDAVGTCSQCGKAACRDCIRDVGGTLLCKGCIVLQLREQTERKEAHAAALHLTQDEARTPITYMLDGIQWAVVPSGVTVTAFALPGDRSRSQ